MDQLALPDRSRRGRRRQLVTHLQRKTDRHPINYLPFLFFFSKEDVGFAGSRVNRVGRLLDQMAGGEDEAPYLLVVERF
jgi:hypothetical protein